MNNEFLTVVTDEGSQKILYNGGGWNLTPYAYAISSKDVLAENAFENLTPLNTDGTLTDDAEKALQSLTFSTYSRDDQIWYTAPFTYVTRADESSLIHRIVIPSKTTKTPMEIKTIYFLYKNTSNYDEIFLYGLAYAKDIIPYELDRNGESLTKSYFFTFTLDKDFKKENALFTLKYSYPETIESHSKNTDKDIHKSLLTKDGTREIDGVLRYSKSLDFSEADSTAMVSKEYVDSLVSQIKSDNMLR